MHALSPKFHASYVLLHGLYVIMSEPQPTTITSATETGPLGAPEAKEDTPEAVPVQGGLPPPEEVRKPLPGVPTPIPQLTTSLALQQGHDGDDEDDEDDAQSFYGDGAAMSTASLTESILNYRTINGRTYHSAQGDAEYWYTSSTNPKISVCEPRN